MPGVLLNWGGFVFQITTIAYRNLSRDDTWRWASLDRLDNEVAEQWIGWGSKNIRLTGTIAALFSLSSAGNDGTQASGGYVGTHQLDNLRALGDAGQPQQLVDGRGFVFGQYVLISVEEVQDYIIDNGAPRKQEFNIHFRSYGRDRGTGGASANPGGGGASAPMLTFNSPAAQSLLASGNPVGAQGAQAAADLGVRTNPAINLGSSMSGFMSSLGMPASTALPPSGSTPQAPLATNGAALTPQATADGLPNFMGM